MTETRRPVPPDEVFERIGRELGADRVSLHTDDGFRVGSEKQRVVACPESVGELAELMRLAFSESWRIIPAGGGTWLGMGNPPAGFELVVSTARLNRLREYEPADLTATVEAGLPLAEFNATARRHGQWIPLDPFGEPASTIGATVSTGSYGPLRCGYGIPRDWLIGLQVAHIDGRLSRAGGKVVKNVAGYDLCKLYTGSYGTLAIITEMTFKLRSIAPAEKTIVFHLNRHLNRQAGQTEAMAALIELAGQLRQSSLQPAAMELLTPRQSETLPIDPEDGALLLRFLHEPEAVDSQIEECAKIGEQFNRTILSPTEAADFWTGYHAGETGPTVAASLLLNFLPGDLGEVFKLSSELFPGVQVRAHAANGSIRIHFGADQTVEASRLLQLREKLVARGGGMVLTRGNEELRRQVDTWGQVGETGSLMMAIKKMYDPHLLLNPGRFVNGI